MGIPDNFEQCEYLWKFAIGCKQCKIILFTNMKDRLDLKKFKKDKNSHATVSLINGIM